jgi:hypothetical protein
MSHDEYLQVVSEWQRETVKSVITVLADNLIGGNIADATAAYGSALKKIEEVVAIATAHGVTAKESSDGK